MPIPKPTYRAIIFDLDGTAIPNARDGQPSPHLIQTVAKYRDRIHLVAATARPPILALPVIHALGLTEPCVVSGGTILYDPLTRKNLRRTTMSPQAVAQIIAIFHARGYHPHLHDLDIGPAEAQDASLLQDVDIMFTPRIEPADVAPLQHQLDTIAGITATNAPSWSGQHFVFYVTHQDATKEHAVAEVLDRLGVPREQSIGIGDGDGDLHLFAAVGLKIAMGNAGPALKAAADLIAPPQDQDGLATIIQRYASDR